MALLKDIVHALDEELKTSSIPDYSGAMNGLQLETEVDIKKIALAVDATLPVVKKAAASGAQLLIVHHGLFWQGAEKIIGPFYKKLRCAIDCNLGIYSNHIPLDVHPRLGNNAVLAKRIADIVWEPFFDWKGVMLGLTAELDMTVGDVAARLASAVEAPLLLGPRMPERPAGTVGIITGGAGSEVKAMHSKGVQTFISGEAPHWAHGLSEELDIELLLAGHYATETFGVKALGKWLEAHFEVESEFISHPSHL